MRLGALAFIPAIPSIWNNPPHQLSRGDLTNPKVANHPAARTPWLSHPNPEPCDKIPFLGAKSAQESKDPCDMDRIMSTLRKPTEVEMRSLMLAKARAYKKLNEMTNRLNQREPRALARAKLFFGADVCIDGLITGLNLIKRTISMVSHDKSFVVDPIKDDCNIVAFVFLPQSAGIDVGFQGIFMRQNFFEAPRYAQGTTMIHEAAHLALRVEDVVLPDGFGAYGENRAIYLAVTQPEQAIHNADNWAKFVDSWPSREVEKYVDIIMNGK